MPTSRKTTAKTPKKPATASAKAGGSVASKSASAALQGKKAPAFALYDADGKPSR